MRPRFVAIALAGAAVATANGPVPTVPEEFEERRAVTLTAAVRVEPRTEPSTVRVRLWVPGDVAGRQELLGSRYSYPPTRVYEREGARYVEFSFRELKESLTVTAEFELSLQRTGLRTAERDAEYFPPVAAPDRRYWTQPSPWIESNEPELRAAALELKQADDVWTLRAIHDFTVGHLRYSGYSPGDLGALAAFRERRGDCTEFAQLFVALARACDIPARVACGVTAGAAEGTPLHEWPEAWVDGIGWIPFDPTHAAHSRSTTFERLENKYILLSTIQKDPELEGFQYFSWRWSDHPATVHVQWSATPTPPQRIGKVP